MLEDFGFISRDIYAFYPLLIRFIDRNKTHWITQRNVDAEELFWRCADIFLHWAASVNFRREEQNYVVQNDIDNMAVITADHGGHQVRQVSCVNFWVFFLFVVLFMSCHGRQYLRHFYLFP